MKPLTLIAFFILVLTFTGCVEGSGKSNPDLVERRQYVEAQKKANRYRQMYDSLNQTLRHFDERHQARFRFIEQKVELISAIQEKLNTIEIHGVRLNQNFTELKQSNIKKDKEILEKIDFLKEQLRSTYEIIEKLKSRDQSGKIREFEETIKRLNHSLKLRKENIESLEKKIKGYINTLHHQDKQITSQKRTIKVLKEENAKLDKKHLFIFSKTDFRRQVLSSKSIYLPYPERNINIISSHPRAAFRIKTLKKGLFVKNKNELVISDWQRFFNKSSFLIIQIDARTL